MGKLLGTLAIIGLGIVLYRSWKEVKDAPNKVNLKK
jgi:hypothetical protein